MTLIIDMPVVQAAPALRLRPIPVAEPHPAVGVLPEPLSEVTTGQAVLPLEAPTVPAPHVAAPVRHPANGLPAPHDWALHFSQAALEVATGLRPPAQLQRWTTPPVLASLTRRHALAQRGGGRPPRATVRSLRVCEPAASVGEVSAVVTDGPRVRALAFRMEGDGGRWRVSALELG